MIDGWTDERMEAFTISPLLLLKSLGIVLHYLDIDGNPLITFCTKKIEPRLRAGFRWGSEIMKFI